MPQGLTGKTNRLARLSVRQGGNPFLESMRLHNETKVRGWDVPRGRELVTMRAVCADAARHDVRDSQLGQGAQVQNSLLAPQPHVVPQVRRARQVERRLSQSGRGRNVPRLQLLLSLDLLERGVCKPVPPYLAQHTARGWYPTPRHENLHLGMIKQLRNILFDRGSLEQCIFPPCAWRSDKGLPASALNALMRTVPEHEHRQH